jgi:hypothetical protein
VNGGGAVLGQPALLEGMRADTAALLISFLLSTFLNVLD